MRVDNQMQWDRFCNDIENRLSQVARVPVVGTLAGAAKVSFGTVQLITAVASAIFSFAWKDNFISFDRSVSHIKHGLGNIAAGVAESIPFLGFFIYRDRQKKEAPQVLPHIRLVTHHENKWMPYASLESEDLEIKISSENLYLREKLNYIEDRIYEKEVEEGFANVSERLEYSRRVVKNVLDQMSEIPDVDEKVRESRARYLQSPYVEP